MMGNLFRSILLGILALGLMSAAVATFAEPFFAELYQLVGIDTSAWVRPMLSFVSSPLVTAILIFVFGLTVGAWAHFGLSKFDKKSGEFVSTQLKDVINQEYRMCTVPIDGKRFVQCSFDDVTFHWEGGGNYEFIDCKYAGRRGISVKGGKLGGLLNLLKTLRLLEDSVSKNMLVTQRD